MTTIAHHEAGQVIGGVDTHKDVHVAAVIDAVGRLLATESFPTTRHGYRRPAALPGLPWRAGRRGRGGMRLMGSGRGPLPRRSLRQGRRGEPANRQKRRLRGKSDTLDAEAAARAVLSGEATATPKAGTGPVEALRQLRIARSGAMKARTAAANQLHSLIDTAPDAIRSQLNGLSLKRKVALAERWRPGSAMTVEAAAKRALVSVARRWRALDDEAKVLDSHVKVILDEVAGDLIAVHGVGHETAGQLLVTAGDNPDRLGHEKSFAALCGSSPVPANSGKTTNRHRLNRGGDRHANSALWTIVRSRMVSHAPTRAYVERRTAQGMPKLEIMRCLKRYVARELFPLIQSITIAQERLEEDAAGSQNCCLTSRGASVRASYFVPTMQRATPGILTLPSSS